MYKQFYDEIAEGAPSNARAAERQAFERSIALLEKAKAAGPKSREAVEALYFTNRLWSFLLDDLASPENNLPLALRGKLISIGIWIMKRADAIREGAQSDFQPLIDISHAVHAGLGSR